MCRILFLVGRNIKKYRALCGLSQEKLGELSGLHRTYIGAVERGEKNISIKNLYRIAEALNVPIYQLLTFDDSK